MVTLMASLSTDQIDALPAFWIADLDAFF